MVFGIGCGWGNSKGVHDSMGRPGVQQVASCGEETWEWLLFWCLTCATWSWRRQWRAVVFSIGARRARAVYCSCRASCRGLRFIGCGLSGCRFKGKGRDGRARWRGAGFLEVWHYRLDGWT